MTICGTCKAEFENDDKYLDHVCTTGFTPRDPDHLGPDFARVSKTATERGEKRVELEGQGLDPQAAQAKAAEVVAEANAVVA